MFYFHVNISQAIQVQAKQLKAYSLSTPQDTTGPAHNLY